MNRKDVHRLVGWLVAGSLLSAAVFALGGCKPVDNPPVAVIQYSPSAPNAGEAVVFDGRGSNDPEAHEGNGIELYEWTFGDNRRAVGEGVTHIYSTAGSYAVTLKVTDATGGVATVAETITVSAAIDNAPIAVFSFSPSTPKTGDVVTFSASGSQDPAHMASKSIAAYAWSFGDGGSGQGVTVSHTYTQAGAYTVALTVTDDQGANGVAQRTVAVTRPTDGNTPPVARFTVTPASPYYKNQTLTFSAESSYDPAALGTKSISLYSWQFGDGSAGAGEIVSHSYAATGTYSVELTVADDDGATQTKTATVVVQDYVIPPPPPPPG
jgi:PKD repeat protein